MVETENINVQGNHKPNYGYNFKLDGVGPVDNRPSTD